MTDTSSTAPRGRRTRLFVDAPLAPGNAVPLAPDQAHYLRNVLRLSVGAAVLAFNGRDGEWDCELAALGKKSGALIASTQRREQAGGPDCWLLFAPVKSTRTDFMVEKATELGARRLVPVLTRLTQTARLKVSRQQAHAIEAAEQCGRLDVPQVLGPRPLAAVLDDWPAERALLFCDEAGGAPLAAFAGRLPQSAPIAILVGPEGGFDEGERTLLRARPFVHAVSLGARILRAETAVVAALAITLTAMEHED
ncbi:MAG: 16S rRNA (uracil(1498)-N(3))-methyltransferase [Alphaproteobacteria bacterium]|nr:16S rRNA (uracil(1498)-N(3))-methyltransferase [Alphaproteobacteria bacterium]